MAITQVEQQTEYVKPKKSGSKIGGLLGLIGGGIGALVTGGMSIPATVGALAGGASLGQTVGGMVKPGQEGGAVQKKGLEAPQESAMTRKLKSGENIAKMNQIAESAKLVAQLPPQQQAQYMEPLLSAQEILKRQMGA